MGTGVTAILLTEQSSSSNESVIVDTEGSSVNNLHRDFQEKGYSVEQRRWARAMSPFNFEVFSVACVTDSDAGQSRKRRNHY